MCKQTGITATPDTQWYRSPLSRRQFAAGGGALTLAACTGMGANGEPATGGSALTENTVVIDTPDGDADAEFIHPASGSHPAIVFWPDIAGVREANRMMARRVAAEGYAVLLVNPYYRDVTGEQFADFAAFRAGGGFDTVGPWREKLSSRAVMRDAAAHVGWLDGQDAVETARGIGTEGYCMGGPFTVYTAAAAPGRVKAAGSFHGGGLVRDDEDSPHKLLAGSPQTSYLFAIAQDDDADAPENKTMLRAAADAANVRAEVDVYAGDHGWTVPDSPAYDRAAAERAYAAKMALYASSL